MCKNQCGILVNQEGDAVKVSANRNHPQAGICGRGAAAPYILNHPDRLKGPMVRRGGVLEQTDWETALGETVKALRKVREENPRYLAITFHDYGKELLERFAYLYGTPNLIGHEAVCHGPRTVASQLVLGAEGPRSLDPDYPNSKFVVFLSRNPLEGIVPEIVRRIDLGRSKGMRVTVVDPRRSALAQRYAERWIAIRPGTDTALLLSLAYYMIEHHMYDEDFLRRYSNASLLVRTRDMTSTGEYHEDLLYKGEMSGEEVATAFWLFRREGEKVYPSLQEITGASYDDVKYLAENLWENRPSSVIDDGWHTSYAMDSTYTWMTAFIINAMLGNLDRRGGLVFAKRPKVKLYDGELRRDRIDRYRFPLTYASFQEVYRAILTGKPHPIRALMVVGTNLDGRDANSSMVREALSRVEFLVTVDIFPSDVTQYAHVVLAESTFLERDELPGVVGWSLEPWVDAHQAAVKPIHDTRPLHWILLELERRLGLSQESYEDLERRVLTQLKVNETELRTKGAVRLQGEVYDQVPYVKPLGTESGKVEIYSRRLRELGYYPIPTYVPGRLAPQGENQFYLVTGHTLYHTQDSITFDIPTLIKLAPDNPLQMNRRRAEKLGIRDGDLVEVRSLTTGESVRCRVKVTGEIREDIVFAYFGFGRHSKGLKFAYGHGFDVNLLISDEIVDPIAGSVAQSQNIVEVRKAEK